MKKFVSDAMPSFFFNNLMLFIILFGFLEFRKHHEIGQFLGFWLYIWAYIWELLVTLYNANFETIFYNLHWIILYIISSIMWKEVPHSLFCLRFFSSIFYLGINIILEIFWLFIFNWFSELDYLIERKKERKREKSRFRRWEKDLLTREGLLKQKEENLTNREFDLSHKADSLLSIEQKMKYYLERKNRQINLAWQSIYATKENAQSQIAKETNELLNENA